MKAYDTREPAKERAKGGAQEREQAEELEGKSMSERTRVSHSIYNLLPTEIEGFDSLAELALDMRWSWNHATDNVWRLLDPELWEITHNPWVVLQTVSRDQIERVLADPIFRKNVDGLVQSRRQTVEGACVVQQNHSQGSLSGAACRRTSSVQLCTACFAPKDENLYIPACKV